MNDQSPPGSPLETIRAEIDGIDKTLLSLLADRWRAVDKMSGLKPPEHGLPIRPGREVALLRRLVAEAPAPLERLPARLKLHSNIPRQNYVRISRRKAW